MAPPLSYDSCLKLRGKGQQSCEISTSKLSSRGKVEGAWHSRSGPHAQTVQRELVHASGEEMKAF